MRAVFLHGQHLFEAQLGGRPGDALFVREPAVESCGFRFVHEVDVVFEIAPCGIFQGAGVERPACRAAKYLPWAVRMPKRFAGTKPTFA